MTLEREAEILMICALAREIRDGERVGVGTLSPLCAAAAWLAQAHHAPRAEVVVLGHPDWPFYDGSKEFFDWAQRGRLDVFFLSGGQIDRRGNINLTAVGPYASPRVRLPGAAGSAVLYYAARRTILFKTDHSPRGLVEQVDFVTAPGRAPPGFRRRGGPAALVTPRAVFDWDADQAEWVVRSLSPGETWDGVQAATGFALAARGAVGTTPPPGSDELYCLETLVRPRLAEVYPEFTHRLFGATEP
ncbi:MAG: CoA synthetase [Actinomycetia bacterium]|nr:CoA synthetase [Actinomycetes bacterium]